MVSGSPSRFFRTWHALRLPSLDYEVVDLLGKMKLKGNRKGDAVRSFDPRKGQFSDIEFQAIIGALNDAFASGRIDTEDFILVWLCLAFGARPIQLATLKVSDFSSSQSSEGTIAYILRIPRAKQRGQAPRTELKPRMVVPEVGRLLEGYCKTAKERWRNLGLGEDGDAPFFVNAGNGDAIPSLRYHCTANELSHRVQSVFHDLDVISERTGEPLEVVTRRFRYTVGTRAAAEGASELVIAEILDHSDTQNVGVYVEAVPEIVERIDRALATQLAPIAQAFSGVLVEREKDAVRGDDPHSRIVSPADFAHPVGNCGSYGFCGATAPIACYTCRNFQPWLDGPHEQVLDQLIADRDRILRDTGDMRIASVNDRLILACAEVVRRCTERRADAI